MDLDLARPESRTQQKSRLANSINHVSLSRDGMSGKGCKFSEFFTVKIAKFLHFFVKGIEEIQREAVCVCSVVTVCCRVCNFN